jgi:hypothetical protein
MRFDSDTTVARLLTAIPSSAPVFEKFGIRADPAEKRTVQEVCMDHGISFEEFVRAINDADWSEEVRCSPSA